jgi:hypothetical protein
MGIMHLIIFEITIVGLHVQETWQSTNTLPTMTNGCSYYNLTTTPTQRASDIRQLVGSSVKILSGNRQQ